jgi:hypothetical protein
MDEEVREITRWVKWLTGVDAQGLPYVEWRYPSGGRAGRAPDLQLAALTVYERFGLQWGKKLGVQDEYKALLRAGVGRGSRQEQSHPPGRGRPRR